MYIVMQIYAQRLWMPIGAKVTECTSYIEPKLLHSFLRTPETLNVDKAFLLWGHHLFYIAFNAIKSSCHPAVRGSCSWALR